MREKMSKEFLERLWKLEDKYEPINDFDLIKVLELEDEYNKLTNANPEHTKRRREILDMRDRLVSRCRYRSPKESIYILVHKLGFQAIVDGCIYPIDYMKAGSIESACKIIAGFLASYSDRDIYIEPHEEGVLLAEILDSENIKYKKLTLKYA